MSHTFAATGGQDTVMKFWYRDFVPCVPARYVLVITSFFGFVNVYALRSNLSMAIITMVNRSATYSDRLVSWLVSLAGLRIAS